MTLLCDSERVEIAKPQQPTAELADLGGTLDGDFQPWGRSELYYVQHTCAYGTHRSLTRSSYVPGLRAPGECECAMVRSAWWVAESSKQRHRPSEPITVTQTPSARASSSRCGLEMTGTGACWTDRGKAGSQDRTANPSHDDRP